MQRIRPDQPVISANPPLVVQQPVRKPFATFYSSQRQHFARHDSRARRRIYGRDSAEARTVINDGSLRQKLDQRVWAGDQRRRGLGYSAGGAVNLLGRLSRHQQRRAVTRLHSHLKSIAAYDSARRINEHCCEGFTSLRPWKQRSEWSLLIQTPDDAIVPINKYREIQPPISSRLASLMWSRFYRCQFHRVAAPFVSGTLDNHAQRIDVQPFLRSGQPAILIWRDHHSPSFPGSRG